jgi:hypothetical protein
MLSITKSIPKLPFNFLSLKNNPNIKQLDLSVYNESKMLKLLFKKRLNNLRPRKKYKYSTDISFENKKSFNIMYDDTTFFVIKNKIIDLIVKDNFFNYLYFYKPFFFKYVKQIEKVHKFNKVLHNMYDYKVFLPMTIRFKDYMTQNIYMNEKKLSSNSISYQGSQNPISSSSQFLKSSKVYELDNSLLGKNIYAI